MQIPKSIVSTTNEAAAGAIQAVSIVQFARKFSSAVGVRAQLPAAALSLATSLTEGAGLALLAPLIAMLGAGPTSNAIGRALADALAALGLPLSLPVLIALFVGVVATRAALVRGRDLSFAALQLDFIDALRRRLFDAVARARWRIVTAERPSVLVRSLTADIERVGQGLHFLLQFPALAVTAVVQIALALAIAPWSALLVLACGGAVAAVVWSRRDDTYQAGQRLAARLRSTFDLTSDFLAGLKLAKAHGAEERHRVAFEAALDRQQEEVLAFTRRRAETRMLFQVGSAVVLGAFVYVGADVAGLAVPELVVLIVIFARLMPLAGELQQLVQSVRQALPILEHLLALIARCEAGAEVASASRADRLILCDELRFSGVCFRYGAERDQPVLDGFDLVVRAGSVVAVVGASGAGKSTIADLAVGLVTPDAGTVSVDGAPLQGALLAAWRASVAYVLQDGFLFNDTVRANMLLWARPDVDEPELLRALTLTGAAPVIDAMPAKLDSIVGDRGSRLSGGERQRVVLACALLRQPTLLVLDEATNALDQESERAMWGVIERLRGSMTIIVIAHRIWTVRGADMIVVLEGGRAVQSGSWDVLMAEDGGRFARLVRAGAAADTAL